MALFRLFGRIREPVKRSRRSRIKKQINAAHYESVFRRVGPRNLWQKKKNGAVEESYFDC